MPLQATPAKAERPLQTFHLALGTSDGTVDETRSCAGRARAGVHDLAARHRKTAVQDALASRGTHRRCAATSMGPRWRGGSEGQSPSVPDPRGSIGIIRKAFGNRYLIGDSGRGIASMRGSATVSRSSPDPRVPRALSPRRVGGPGEGRALPRRAPRSHPAAAPAPAARPAGFPPARCPRPWARAMSRAMARPSPVPPERRKRRA